MNGALLWLKDMAGRILLSLLVVAIIVFVFLHGGPHRPHHGKTLFPLATSTPSATATAAATGTQDLPITQMRQIVGAYYLLQPTGQCATPGNPGDTSATLRARMATVVPPDVLPTLFLTVGTTSVRDKIRLAKCLTEKGTADFTTMKPTSTGLTSFYITVNVTVQQYLPDGAPYQSTDPAAPSVETFPVYFDWVQQGDGSWLLTDFGDGRTAG